MVRSRIRPVLIALASVTLLLAADPAWRIKPAAQWTEQEAQQLLEKSPWSRTVTAGIARRESEDELRDGGKMGQPTGPGYEGVDVKENKARPTATQAVFTGSNYRSARSLVQTMPVRLRWESALPVRLAELKAHETDPPTLEGDGYRIAVYGIPNGNFKGDPKKLGNPLREDAFLRREGKKDVKPSSVEVFQLPDGLAVVYLFPFSAEISKRDGHVEFEAHIGRVVVAQVFNLDEMEFQGKLEI